MDEKVALRYHFFMREKILHLDFSYKILAFLIFAGLFFSLFHSFYFKIPPQVDARAYHNIAKNIISGNGYREDFSLPPEKDLAIMRVGPGYELFLAGIYKIFGPHYQIIWVFQAIFHALTAFLIFLISREIFQKPEGVLIGLFSALFVAFSPDLILASSMLLAENLAIFLLVLSIYFLFKYLNRPTYSNFTFSSLFLILAILTRSQFIFITPLFLLIFKKEWKKIFIFILLFILIFSPWFIRNYKTYGIFLPFNAAAGYNLWNGNHLGASGEMEIDYQPMIEFAKNHTPLELHQKGVAEFKQFLASHPFEFLKITLRRLSIFFSLSRPTGFWPGFSIVQQMITAFFSFIYSIFIFILGFSGMIWAFKKFAGEDKKKILLLALFAFSIPFSVMFLVVETRYRYPIYPFLAIFSGIALVALREIWNKNLKIFLLPLLIFFLNAILDFGLNFTKFWDKLKILF
ncbi:MAG: ArnT family glycosyltransferase [Minisyncoccales bacterium]